MSKVQLSKEEAVERVIRESLDERMPLPVFAFTECLTA